MHMPIPLAPQHLATGAIPGAAVLVCHDDAPGVSGGAKRRGGANGVSAEKGAVEGQAASNRSIAFASACIAGAYVPILILLIVVRWTP